MLKTPITDLSKIKTLLPHREPMIMVDTLLECSEGHSTVGFKVQAEHIFVTNNEFSETGLIEHMAQAAALYIGFKNYSKNNPVKEGFIAAIKSLHIQQLPKVNATLHTEVTIIHEVNHTSVLKVATFINNLEIAHADMTTVLKED